MANLVCSKCFARMKPGQLWHVHPVWPPPPWESESPMKQGYILPPEMREERYPAIDLDREQSGGTDGR